MYKDQDALFVVIEKGDEDKRWQYYNVIWVYYGKEYEMFPHNLLEEYILEECERVCP